MFAGAAPQGTVPGASEDRRSHSSLSDGAAYEPPGVPAPGAVHRMDARKPGPSGPGGMAYPVRRVIMAPSPH